MSTDLDDLESELSRTFRGVAHLAPRLEGTGMTTKRRSGRAVLGVAVAAAAVLLGVPLAVHFLAQDDDAGVQMADRSAQPSSPAGSPAPDVRETIIGRWVPIELEGEPVEPRRAWFTPPYAEFAADGSWNGGDGCNSIRGRYRLTEDGVVESLENKQTRIGCDNFVHPLQPGARITVEGTTLRVHAPDGALLAIYGAG